MNYFVDYMRALLFFFVFLFGKPIFSMHLDKKIEIVGLSLGMTGIVGAYVTYLIKDKAENLTGAISCKDPEYIITLPTAKNYNPTNAFEEAYKSKDWRIRNKVKLLNHVQSFFLFLMISGGGIWANIKRKTQ